MQSFYQKNLLQILVANVNIVLRSMVQLSEGDGKMQIEVIKELCKQSKMKWSAHGLERMQERDISREDI